MQFITASLERLILFIYPTLVILIAAVVYKNKITLNHWLAIIITYSGIFIIFFPDIRGAHPPGLWWGVFLIFLSAFTYALYIAGSGDLIPKIGADLFTAWVMTISCIFVIVHFLLFNHSNVLHLPWQVYGIGFILAIICTVLPSFLVSKSIGLIGSSNFAVLGSLGPVSTITLAIFILGEKLTLYQVVGALVVIVGVSSLKWKKWWRTDPAKINA
ncbi:MAG: DMT family transporter [Cyclobacteriaceae bacterium]